MPPPERRGRPQNSASKKATADALPPSPSLQEQPQAAPVTRPNGQSGVLLVVDGNYLANRAYYGYGNGQRLATSKGVPTSITYSVVRTLRAAIRSVRPTALAVVFDHRGPTFRAALSVLDPSSRTRAGDAAARLVQQGRLDWTDLANRLLAAEPLRADLRAVGAAQDAASPRAYLHPTAATFLPPAGDPAATTSGNPAAEPPLDAAAAGAASSRAAGGWNAEYGATSPATAEDGGDVVRMLAAALGPELAAECGLTEAVAALEAAAAGGGRAVLPPQAYKAGRTPKDEEFYVDFRNLQGVTGIGPKGAVQLLTEHGDLEGVWRAALEGAAGGIAPKRRAALQADWPAAQYTLTMARVLGSPGAPSGLPPREVLPDRLLQRLALRGYEEAGAVAAAMAELEMWTLAREAGPGGELWRDFGGGGPAAAGVDTGAGVGAAQGAA
eukprot:XP_001699444.1 predicted protein [Chlamydomonas reinhardtii]